MTNLQALLLGIIQGITEFLPVSSSGHLELLRSEMHIQKGHSFIGFDLVCHLGTLFSIICVLHRDIYQLISSNRSTLLAICIALIPLFPLLLVMKQIKSVFGHPEYLSLFFFITAVLLFIGARSTLNKNTVSLSKTPWHQALCIGAFQACAIFPGISRSGSTISCALLMGWQKEDAVKFSFLLAIPTILGGLILESKQFLFDSSQEVSVSLTMYLAGFFSSFIVGILALMSLIYLIRRNSFSIFIWYCLAASVYCFFKFTI